MVFFPYFLMIFFALLLTFTEGLNHATAGRWAMGKPNQK
jgi:hypothetical protein